jgi:hypothetical protein
VCVVGGAIFGGEGCVFVWWWGGQCLFQVILDSMCLLLPSASLLVAGGAMLTWECQGGRGCQGGKGMHASIHTWYGRPCPLLNDLAPPK